MSEALAIVADAVEIAPNVHVIPDRRVNLVPNVGVVVGERAALVVDTGMGPRNGLRVLERARELAPGLPLYLTLTHFHPEHGFGAQAFEGEATILYNRVQLEELREKGEPFVDMFRGFGPEVAESLEGVELVEPHVLYGDEAEVDLGGIVVRMFYLGPAHTRGDQLVHLPEEGVLFAGDLVENRFFPILPDEDASASRWIALLARLEELGPRTVVPGHGEVGDVGLARDVREYLEDVQARVSALHAEGVPLEEIEQRVEPEILDRYADWDNPEWVKFAIGNVHGELG